MAYCQNCSNIWQNPGPVGINTTNPMKPLNIHGWLSCPDVTLRLSYGEYVNNPLFAG
jgi:hypothetical protein